MSDETVLYEVRHQGQKYVAILLHVRGFMGIYKLVSRLSPGASGAPFSDEPLVGSIGFDPLKNEDRSGATVELPLAAASVYEPQATQVIKQQPSLASGLIRHRRILILVAATLDLIGWTLLLLHLFGVI